MSILHSLLLNYGIFNGWTREAADEWLKNKKEYEQYGKKDADLIKDYLRCFPIIGKYDKLVDNRLAMRYELGKFKDCLMRYYFQVIERNGQRTFIPLHDYDCSIDVNDCGGLLEYVKEKKRLMIMPSLDIFDENIHMIEYYDNVLHLDRKVLPEEELNKFFSSVKDTYIVTDGFDIDIKQHNKGHTLVCEKITVIMSNDSGSKPKILCAYMDRQASVASKSGHLMRTDFLHIIDEEGRTEKGKILYQWNSLKRTLEEIMTYLREVRFAGIELVRDGEEYKIIVIRSNPILPAGIAQNKEIAEFIERELKQKVKSLNIKRRFFLIAKNAYDNIAQRKGYQGFMMKNWQRDLLKDWFFNGTTFRQKVWSHKRGFLSFRIKQYNLTENNYTNCLSDRDYRKLRPINNQFLYWVYDKVTLRYILNEKKEFLPKYYFHIVNYRYDRLVLPQDDYINISGKEHTDISDVLSLLRNEGKLAFKPSEGSHGEGFAKLEYKRGKYFYNGVEKTSIEMKSAILSVKTPFSITEFIDNHQDLKQFYSGATHTIRVMLINRHGDDPWIANAFLRLATEKTGTTDNIANGGICARIDLETGHIFQAEKIENHIITSCRTHPDTGLLIDGFIPLWSAVKDAVLEVSRYLFQLEYMGFDVVVSDKGIKILEINTHQDLHRYPYYDREIHKYFCEKKEEKTLGIKNRENN